MSYHALKPIAFMIQRDDSPFVLMNNGAIYEYSMAGKWVEVYPPIPSVLEDAAEESRVSSSDYMITELRNRGYHIIRPL